MRLSRLKQRKGLCEKAIVENAIIPNTISPIPSTIATLKTNFANYEVNVRAILTAFSLGTGGNDVGKALSMLEIGGGMSFERNFAKHSPQIGNIFRRV